MSLAWRPLLRDLVSYLLVAGFVAALGTFVWWTRHPDAPSLTAARSLPVVGHLAARLQDRYLAAATRERTGAASTESTYVPPPGSTGAERAPAEAPADGARESGLFEIEYVYEPRPPRPYVWVGENTTLRTEPSFEAASVAVLDAMTNLFVEERRGDWVRVRYQGADAWLVSPRSGSDEFQGFRPGPVLPLPGSPPDAAVERRARDAMSGTVRTLRLGAYEVRSDADVADVVSYCSPYLARLEGAYPELLDVSPLGESAEVLYLFAADSDYASFSRPEVGHGIGHAGSGYAALSVERRSARGACETVVHEVVHLLNRRAVGPALPLWLDEGLAEYFEASVFGGRPSVGGPGPLLDPAAVASLETLTALERAGDAGGAAARGSREISALWIEHFLSDPDLSTGFRAFLGYLAEGGPWALAHAASPAEAVRETPSLGDDLAHFLGRDFARLDAGFRAWLWSRS